jgi:hypothetical protein
MGQDRQEASPSLAGGLSVSYQGPALVWKVVVSAESKARQLPCGGVLNNWGMWGMRPGRPALNAGS